MDIAGEGIHEQADVETADGVGSAGFFAPVNFEGFGGGLFGEGEILEAEFGEAALDGEGLFGGGEELVGEGEFFAVGRFDFGGGGPGDEAVGGGAGVGDENGIGRRVVGIVGIDAGHGEAGGDFDGFLHGMGDPGVAVSLAEIGGVLSAPAPDHDGDIDFVAGGHEGAGEALTFVEIVDIAEGLDGGRLGGPVLVVEVLGRGAEEVGALGLGFRGGGESGVRGGGWRGAGRWGRLGGARVWRGSGRETGDGEGTDFRNHDLWWVIGWGGQELRKYFGNLRKPRAIKGRSLSL